MEPSTGFYCDQLYDPFTFMRINNKRYSFVMSLFEFRSTIETLWASTREFARLHPDYLAANNAVEFLTDSKDKNAMFSKDFNLCHFWSNFEIADLNLWRSKPYRDYFEFLDQKGGFFYERWGDAPVHTIAAAMVGSPSFPFPPPQQWLTDICPIVSVQRPDPFLARHGI